MEDSDLTEIILDSCFNVMNDLGVSLYIADIVVNESVIVEAKCCKELAPQHFAQLINYLKGTGITVGF
ncbi:MAG: GxxExxY protein [Chlamydiota bacterium]|nr:GxxExxY protein [Chlamydiota bacterium]